MPPHTWHAHTHPPRNPIGTIAQALRIQSGPDKQASHTACILVAKTLNKTRRTEASVGEGASVEREPTRLGEGLLLAPGRQGLSESKQECWEARKASMARWNGGLEVRGDSRDFRVWVSRCGISHGSVFRKPMVPLTRYKLLCKNGERETSKEKESGNEGMP